MEKRFVNRTAVCITSFTILMLAWIIYFQSTTALSRARYQQMSGLERLKYYNSNLVEYNEKLENHIRITLPKGVSEKDVSVKNEYARKKIMIHVPRANEGFLFKNPIVGSSNCITDLMAYSQEDGTYIEIIMDSIYESDVHVEDNFMYIGFSKVRDVYDKVVVLDAGHGDTDPGVTAGDVYESDIDLEIALLTKKYLEDNGVKVFMTRNDGYNTTLTDRVALANELKAAAFVSIHNNAAVYKGMNLTGTQTLYNADDETGASKRLAEIALDLVSERFDTRRISCTAGNDIYIVRNSEVPMCLVEVGFMSTNEELVKLMDPEYQLKAAEAVGDAVLKAYEEGIIHD